MKIYPSIDYRYSYLYYDWYFFFFLLIQVSSSLLSYILLSFSCLSQENVLFPASNYLLGFSLKQLLSKVIAHLKRVELLMLNSALSNFISRSLFFCRIQFFTLLE